MAKILLVDDDPDVRKILHGILEPLCEVLEAGDGAAALDLLAKEKPALMLLDLTMPGMSGMEVLTRAPGVHPAVAVVMLTGRADVAQARQALELGARAYITKPFDPMEIRDEVSRLLEEHGRHEGDPPWRVRA